MEYVKHLKKLFGQIIMRKVKEWNGIDVNDFLDLMCLM